MQRRAPPMVLYSGLARQYLLVGAEIGIAVDWRQQHGEFLISWLSLAELSASKLLIKQVFGWETMTLSIRWGIRILAALVAASVMSVAASAQDLVYEPVSPSFGGNPFNSSHLLATAEAQNKYRDPRQAANGLGTSQADLFVRQLQSRLLSGLSSQIADSIFGENPQDNGTIVFGSQTVTFTRNLDNITLTIFDSDTGETTTIVIPQLTVE